MEAYKKAEPRANPRHTIALAPMGRIPGPVRTPFLAFIGFLFALTGALLAIACSNVAGMQLARAATRRREMATRLAVGAGRQQLIRQLLTETMVLFAAAAIVSVPLTIWLVAMLEGSLPALPVILNLDFGVNVRVMAFAFGLALVTGLVFGLAPARHALGADLAPMLHGAHSTADRKRFRLRNSLVAAQVALSLMLVVTAFLFLRSLEKAAHTDPGFETANIQIWRPSMCRLAVIASNRPWRWRERFTGAARGNQRRGVGGARAHDSLAGQRLWSRQRARARRDGTRAGWPVRRGLGHRLARLLRDHQDAHRRGPRVPRFGSRGRAAGGHRERNVRATGVAGTVGVGRTFMQQIERERRTRRSRSSAWRRTRSIATSAVRRRRSSTCRWRSSRAGDIRVLRPARTRPADRARRFAPAMAQVEPNVPVLMLQSFDDAAAIGLLPQKLAAWIAGSVGTIGIFLAALGLYGLMAFLVAQRTREIAIRMALGASDRDMRSMVLKQAGSLAAIGGVIGLVLAGGIGTLAQSLLVGVPPIDPISFGGTALLFAVVLAVAAWTPAQRRRRPCARIRARRSAAAAEISIRVDLVQSSIATSLQRSSPLATLRLLPRVAEVGAPGASR